MSATTSKTTTTTQHARSERRPRISPELARRAKEHVCFSGAWRDVPIHERVPLVEALDRIAAAQLDQERIIREIAQKRRERAARQSRRRSLSP